MNRQDEEYLLKKINESLSQKWHEVTPEYLASLKKRKLELEKQKKND